MFETMRKTFGPVAVSAIIGAIAMVFVFYGVYNPKTGGGINGGAMAAKVNGEVIPMIDFKREYNARLEYFSNMFKGKDMDPQFLKQLGIHKQIIDELVQRKLVSQEAKRLGMVVSDAEIRTKIMDLEYFKKDGKFDPETYKQLLQANRKTPSEFETAIREDTLRMKFVNQLQSMAKVTEKEIKDEFLTTEDRRQVDYIHLERDNLKKLLVVSAKEIDEFLSKPDGVEKAKAHYESTKYEYAIKKPAEKETEKNTEKKKTDPKKEPEKPQFKAYETVKRDVVTDLLRERKTQELTEMNKKLAEETLAKAKDGASSELKAFLKTKGVELKSSEKFNRLNPTIANIGAVAELITDAYKADSPLSKGAKMYMNGVNYVIAMNVKSFSPNESDFEKKKEEVEKQLVTRKSQQLSKEWMDSLKKNAKIVVSEGLGADPASAGTEE